VQEAGARWLFTVGDSSEGRFLRAKSLVYRFAFKGDLERHQNAWKRDKPNAQDLGYTRSQAQALRLHEGDMLELERLHPELFVTIEHFPGELMIVPPGGAHAVFNLRSALLFPCTTLLVPPTAMLSAEASCINLLWEMWWRCAGQTRR
jgi:hypothetical protein